MFIFLKKFFNKRVNFIYLLAFAMPLAFQTWLSLVNNFSIEIANFTGENIGILHSLREIPGFLAFLAIYLLLIFTQQKLAILSLVLLSFGVMATGIFPSIYGLYFTTILMSIGFHYLETIQQSITMQWIPKNITAIVMSHTMAIKSIATVLVYICIYVFMDIFEFSYKDTYLVFGSIGLFIALIALIGFKEFKDKTTQSKKLIFRKKYWLFYVLTFLSGARRQIFVVFAGFLLVEKFNYSVQDMLILMFTATVLNIFTAKLIGKLIVKIGERLTLHIEYIGLIIIFVAYAYVDSALMAGVLFCIDYLLFAMVIATKTYFQKIAHREDIASSAGISFTINHIAAVVLPVFLGIIWVNSYSYVFLIGAFIALISLFFSFKIPKHFNI